MNYREATLQDRDALIEYGLRSFAVEHQLGSTKMQANPEKVAAVVDHHLAHGKFFLALREDKIVGFLGVGIADYWWADASFVSDTAFYVDPDERGRGAAKHLILMAIKYAELLGYPLHIGIFNTSVDMVRTKTFLERLGFQQVGYTMMRA